MGTDDVAGQRQRVGRSFQHPKARRARFLAIVAVLRSIADGSEKDPIGAAKKALDALPHARRGPPRRKQLAGFLHEASSATPIPTNVGVTVAELVKNAEEISERYIIEDAALAYLYRHSRWNHIERAEWEKAVRTACAASLLSGPFLKGRAGRDVGDLIDRNAAAEAFRELRAPHEKGILLMTFHGGFFLIAIRLFSEYFKNGNILGKGGLRQEGQFISDNYSDSLFAALRILQNAGQILIAPDGPRGRQAPVLRVLGADMPAGEGAAFLAHASGCRTAWYTVTLRGDRFVPLIVLGPTRNGKETLESFRERLFRFCSEQIEAFVTGDPHTLALGPKWFRRFGMLDPDR